MTQRISVSVVVPYRNEEAHLGACLSAFDRQSAPRDSFELLFVDDGSVDRSRAIVESWPGVRSLAATGRGPYSARNQAVAVAQGDWIAFTDADCVVDPGWIAAIAGAPAEAQMMWGPRRHTGGDLMALVSEYENARVNWLLRRRPRLMYGQTNNMAVRKEVFARWGRFVEVIRGGDTEFVRRYVRAGGGGLRFEPGMAAVHCEYAAFREWVVRQSRYGISEAHMQRGATPERLRTADQLAIFGSTVKRLSMPKARAARLFCGLALGRVSFGIGVAMGRRDHAGSRLGR